jgi:outer membrane lipoprotein SlyB
MNTRIVTIATAAALALASTGAFALGNNEKGCLVGGAIGGIAGQAIKGDSKSTLIGAGLGCGAGYLVNKERVKKNNETADLKKKNARLARKNYEQQQAARSNSTDPRNTQYPR